MRRLGLLAVVAAMALLAGTAWAAFVQEGGPYPTGAAPGGVYAADFSGDGLNDIAVVNGTDSNVNLFFRQPAGGFAAAGTISVGPGAGPSFGAVADYNGDGRPDLAVANFVANNVFVLKSDGIGGVVTESTQTSARLSAIGAGNFDGDTLTDVVVAEWDNGLVRILNRNASGTGFTLGAAFATGVHPRQIEVADFDGDSLADIAVTNADNNTVTVLRRSGSSFVAEGSFPVGASPQDLAIADYNGDGRPDIAIANHAPAGASVLLRNATNDGFTLESGSPIPLGETATATGITTADFNLDTRADLAVATTGGVRVLLRNSGGGFTSDAVLAPDAHGIAAADFDRDGRPDIAATSDVSSQLRTFLNPLSTQPPPAPTPTPTPTPTLPAPVAGRTVNATPVEGTVKVKLPGSRRYVDLAKAEQLPVGTSVDARKGAVQITAAGDGGTAKFFDGIFKISQGKGKRPLTTVTLTETLSCPKAKKSAATSAAKKKSRKLWGDGKGAFRTQGKYSAATVRGTKWLVTDYCDRTVTRVTQGSVTVKGQGKTKVVRAGKRFTVRKKKR